jgi:hypothetical protein
MRRGPSSIHPSSCRRRKRPLSFCRDDPMSPANSDWEIQDHRLPVMHRRLRPQRVGEIGKPQPQTRIRRQPQRLGKKAQQEPVAFENDPGERRVVPRLVRDNAIELRLGQNERLHGTPGNCRHQRPVAEQYADLAEPESRPRDVHQRWIAVAHVAQDRDLAF